MPSVKDNAKKIVHKQTKWSIVAQTMSIHCGIMLNSVSVVNRSSDYKTYGAGQSGIVICLRVRLEHNGGCQRCLMQEKFDITWGETDPTNPQHRQIVRLSKAHRRTTASHVSHIQIVKVDVDCHKAYLKEEVTC